MRSEYLLLFLIAFPISGVFNTISSLEESQRVPNNYTASGMTSNGTVTWKKIVVAYCLAIDCPDAGTGSPGSLESTSRRTSPALRSTTAWSQSSSSGPSMRFRWPRTPGQAWASSVSLSLSTHCREVRPCFSVTLSGFFFWYLTVAASIGHCVFIYSFSSAEGGSMLVWTGWCSTCLHATLRSTLSFHIDTTFILEPSSQRANFHANLLQNNYVNYVQGPLFSSDEKNASREIQSLLIWTFWMIIWGAANVSTLLWGFICLIILNRHNINRVCQAIEWYWCSSAEHTHN